MKSQLILLAPCCLLLATVALAEEAKTPPEAPQPPPDLVARVNQEPITMKMLSQAMEERIPFSGHRSLSEKRYREIQREELNKLIIRELLVQEARRLSVRVAPKEVDSELSKIRARFQSEKQFKEALLQQGLSVAEVREGLERRLLVRAVTEQEVVLRVVISDQELEAYYEGHREQFVIPEQIRLRLILTAVDSSALQKDWDEARMKAQGLSDWARGGEDFVTGDTGLLHRGRLPYHELESIAFSLNIGEVSDPIQTLYGYVVFKVEEKKPSRPLSYEEVNKELLRSEMKASAADRRWREWIQGLKARAEITIY